MEFNWQDTHTHNTIFTDNNYNLKWKSIIYLIQCLFIKLKWREKMSIYDADDKCSFARQKDSFVSSFVL